MKTKVIIDLTQEEINKIGEFIGKDRIHFAEDTDDIKYVRHDHYHHYPALPTETTAIPSGPGFWPTKIYVGGGTFY